MHALAAVHMPPPMKPVSQQTWPEAHWFVPHIGPCVPAAVPLLLLVLPLLLEPAPLLLPVPLPLPLLLVLPAVPLLPLLVLPLLEPLLPPPPPPLLPASSPAAVDEVPPHANGVPTTIASEATTENRIVLILHLLGPSESVDD
jgi:hypothetical protein